MISESPQKIILEGPRIILRPPVPSDTAIMNAHVQVREISRYTFISRLSTLESTREFIRNTRKWWRSGRQQHFGIIWKESKDLIGMIGLSGIDHKNCNAELGYWLAKEYWGRGITPEAIRLILDYSFRTLKLVRVYAHVMHPNEASIRVLEKIGFKREGYLRKAVFQHNRWLNEILFAILKEEYQAKRFIKRF
ncbi:putative Uncharacterized N-acetyltransferase p20 [Candidatus Zixiibacteriota bacterium]|nr:putative Uncharacterized N-acetyltransferase p20 [candidate division Zixibacteria bacterium]